MTEVARHGFLGKCELCGARVALPRGKSPHYRKAHPEILFESVHRVSGGKNKLVYSCGRCKVLQAGANFAQVVAHYRLHHADLLERSVVSTSPNPVEHVDKFFDGLTNLMLEIERLRKEKEEWMKTAAKWSKRIVELQELLGKKP